MSIEFSEIPEVIEELVSDSLEISIASAFLNKTPMVAPLPVDTMIDMGVARPRAHGQAMINTDTATIRA